MEFYSDVPSAMDQPRDLTTTSPLARLLGVRMAGTGSFVPDNVVRNEDLEKIGCDPQWIFQRSGIRARRHAPPEYATRRMAVEAASRCLEQCRRDPSEVDLLIVGTFTPDQLLPTVACQVQDDLRLRCPAMDLQAACAGFIYALVTAAQYVATGCSRLALVIGADCNSRVCDPSDKKTYPLFGDAAGAVLVERGEKDQGLASYTLGADGSGGDMLCRPLGGSLRPFCAGDLAQNRHMLQMDGRAVFKWAVRLVVDSVEQVLRHAEVGPEGIQLVVLHQANIRIIDAAVAQLGFRPEQVVVNLEEYGNTSAASIPLALDEAFRGGRIRRGDQLLLCGFGAGLTWGTALWRW